MNSQQLYWQYRVNVTYSKNVCVIPQQLAQYNTLTEKENDTAFISINEQKTQQNAT